MSSVGMIVVPAIMPLSELRCAIWLCVLAVQGVQELATASTHILCAHFPTELLTA